ncbi:MAG TPA: LegC family aminotransferase [Pyrinomonadaceae bacterium]|nr:LegC family aminotransferase [Pyrinomonadaceae bacterium]
MNTSFEPGAPVEQGSIPLSVPEIRGNEWKYVKECLDTGWVSSVGSFVERFERELAAYVGRKYAVAVASGTAALHIALLVADVKPDDEVLVPTLTFIAPANAIRYVGAWPVFIDVEPDYWQLDAQKVASFLKDECRWSNGALRNKRTGRRVKAILPVHILGHPVDMDPILELARLYNLAVIEDATESLGATYKGRMVGCLGDSACFSFNGNKIITTGGGGMLVTYSEPLARKAKYLTTQAKDDAVEYIHHEIGYNYRLTNLQAALGCAQMEQLNDRIAAKRRIAAAYTENFKGLRGITPMGEAPWAQSIYWLYTILIDEREYGECSRRLMNSLAEQGIQSRPLWQPLHLSPAHVGSQSYQCTIAEKLNREALSLPCSSGLGAEQLTRVVTAIKDFSARPLA